MCNMNYGDHRVAIYELTRTFLHGRHLFDPIERAWVEAAGKVSWFEREHSAARMHPVIDRAMQLAPARNLYQLVREWPHASDTDSSRIAYTRNDADGERDRQTVTTAAKYLTRHFPTLAPHHIRDLMALYGAQEFAMWDTLDNIIRGAQEGPRSCMQWDNDSVDERGGHPYEVYEPEYGWRMAVRLQGSRVMGRCLVNIDPHDESNKTFVRSYKRDENEGYSHSDEGLEAWLRAAGYTKTSGWEGCSIAYKTPTPRYGDREPLLPYLDGDAQNVSVRTSASGKQYFRIVDCGEEYDYESNNTNGRGDPAQRYTCACCGYDFNSLDDSLNAGYYGDDLIGECCSNEFIEVRGRNGREYYIHMDNAVEVNGDYYHDQYLDDNNIVELNNGDYALADEAVEINGEWYAQDDDRIVTLVDTGDAALCDEDCWQCNESGDWYSTCIDPVEIDGNTYHPDSEAAQAHAAESNETEE